MTKKFNTSTRALTLIVMLAILLTSLPLTVFGHKEDDEAYDQVGEILEDTSYTRLYDQDADDLYSLLFGNGDGIKTKYVYSYPVKYIKADGSIADKSLNLVNNDDYFVTESNDIVSSFSKMLSEGIDVSYKNTKIELTPLFMEKDTEGVLSESRKTVSYDVGNRISVEYSLTYMGVKEDIIVEEYNGVNTYEFILKTNGLTPREIDGSYFLVNDKDEFIVSLGDVLILTADERNNTFGKMEFSPIKENEEYILTIHIDEDYLLDEKTTYPITIDPSIEILAGATGTNPAIEDVTIGSSNTYGPKIGALYVGTTSAGNPLRSLMRFTNLDVTGNAILNASVEIRDLRPNGTPDTNDVECYIYTGNAWSESSTVTWSSVGNDYIGSLLDAHRMTYDIGTSLPTIFRYSFDITELACKWANGSADPSLGIVFKSSDEFENGNTNAFCSFGSYNRSAYQPTLSITYLDIAGINSTFTNETFSLDDQVTNYIGHKYGNLVSVYSMPVAAGDFPLDVFYAYNGTFTSQEFFDKYSLSSATYGKFGYGWKLSLIELLIADGKHYRYIDANGTEYFWKQTTAGKYVCDVFENGSLTKNSDNTLTLDLGDGIERNFNTSGFISSITYDDITYNYNYSSNKLSSITSNGTTLLSFTYSSNYLTKVNYTERLSSSTYTRSYMLANSSSKISSISDIYGNNHNYSYSTSSFSVTSALTTDKYTFTNPLKVTNAARYKGNNQINSTGISYSDENTKYNYNNYIINYVFDASGRTINTITESTDGKTLYNASYSLYSDEGELMSSDTTGEGYNLLANSSMEASGTWNGSFSYSTNNSLMGAKSALLAPTASSNKNLYQNVSLSQNNGYVLSAYVKMSDVSLVSSGAAGGVSLKVVKSGSTVAQSDSFVFSEDDGWMRIWLPFTADSSSTYSLYVQTTNITGNIYVDCAQLEKDNTPSTYNAITNGTFESGTSSWTGGSAVTSNVIYGTKSLSVGSGASTYQTVTLGGSANRGFTVSGFAKISSRSIKNPYVKLTFTCSGGTYVKDVPFNGNILSKQYIAYNVSVPESYGNITSVKYAVYNPTSSAVVVDDLMLSFGEYYVSDESETASMDLNFVSNNDGTCYVYSVGNCTDEDVVIPEKSPAGDTVTSIGSNSFKNNINIKSVYVPKTVKGIGIYAFYGCSNLETVSGCEGLETIRYNAFENCTKLKDFPFGEKLARIETYAFASTALTEADLSGNLSRLESGAFEQCQSLETVIFGNSLVNINSSAFEKCTALKYVYMSDSIASIASRVFYKCTSLKLIQISKSLSSVGSNAFYNCPSSVICATKGSSLSVSVPGTVHYNSEISGNFMYTYSSTSNGGKSTEVTYVGDASGSTANTKMFTSVTYDGNGRIVSYTDESGNTTTYEYNGYGDLVKVTNAKNVETTYSYNTNGLLTSVSSAGMTNTYAYTNGQVTYVTHTGSSYSETYSFTYDVYGNLTSVKVGTQPLVTYTYDSTVKDRLVSMSYPNSYTETYAYDIFGNNVSTSVNGTVRYKYTYDADGSLVYFADLQNNVHDSYCYDEYGFAAKYTFNSSGKVVKNEEIDNDAATSEENDVFDRVISKTITANDTDVIIRSFGYDNGSNYYSSYLTKTENFSNGSTVNSKQFSYEYDALGNLTKVKESGTLKITYTYDDLSQLIREDNAYANKSYTWTYDGNGNILNKKTYAYTTGTLGTATATETNTYSTGSFKDQMISHAGHTISYDALGNPANWYSGNKTFSNITWEGRKLTGMTVGSTAYTYSYNSEGIRTKKQNGSNVVEYLYDDGGNLVEEKHGTYSIYFIYDDANELIGFKVSNGGTYYYGKDVFGVIKYIYNASGTIVGTYTYDAWGNTISSTGTTDTNLNPIRYKDYYYDSESGFYYLQSRYYDPQVGRFVSADDTGYLGATGTVLSFNVLSYCYNNPVNNYDPSGHFATVGVVATQSILTILSNYLAGLIASLSASIASIQSALITCWIPIVCISLTAIAVASIALIIKKSIDLQSHAKSIRTSVDKVITNCGVDPKKEGDNSVYIIVRKKDKEVVYVGRTSNFKARSAYHRRTRFPEKTYNIFIVKTGLSLKESRALEQSLITAYGLDTLQNMINSISPKKWDKFKDEFDRMLKLIGAFYDPE